MQARHQPGVPGLQERGEGVSPQREVGPGVVDDAPEDGQGRGVAEGQRERRALRADLGVGVLHQLREHVGPGGRPGDRSPALQGLVDPGQDRPAVGRPVGLAEGLEQVVERLPRADRADPADGEGEDPGDLRPPGQLEGASRVGGGEGLEGVPLHQGQVVVVGVFRMAQ